MELISIGKKIKLTKIMKTTMKKTIKSMLALMAGAMAFSACSNEPFESDMEQQGKSQLTPMTFTATPEGENGGTRATIDNLDIKWTANDSISVFDGSDENCGNQKFTLTEGAGTTSATFSGSAATSGTYYALYPYNKTYISDVLYTEEEAIAIAGSSSILSMMERKYNQSRLQDYPFFQDLSPEKQDIILAYFKRETHKVITGRQRQNDNELIDVVFPAEQKVKDGQSVDPTAILMIAESSNNDFSFKNACAYIKVTPDFNCHAIAFRSNGTDSLAGTVTLNYNNGEPTATVTANSTNEVDLVGDIKAANTYYIAVLPDTLKSGFTIEFLTKDKDSCYARTSNKELILARNTVLNLGKFSTGGTWNEIISPLCGTDSEGHTWIAISENLKVATTSYDVSGARYDLQGTWGEDWELLNATEFEKIAKCFTIANTTPPYYLTSTKGVYKYTNSDTITIYRSNNIWLAGDEDAEGKVPYVSIYGQKYKYSTMESTMTSNTVLFKYVGE